LHCKIISTLTFFWQFSPGNVDRQDADDSWWKFSKRCPIGIAHCHFSSALTSENFQQETLIGKVLMLLLLTESDTDMVHQALEAREQQRILVKKKNVIILILKSQII